MKPHQLPVYKQKDKILKSLETNQVIVVESPTGSGKTTQLPLILHKAGYSDRGVIGVTQPRRIAALSVCDYISKQLKKPAGTLAGFKMRFEDRTTLETRIKIMTDGILLQELKHDPLLLSYSVIMVDEAHERTLNIDFILGLLKNILPQRPDLKIIVSSATINARIFSDYFNKCPVVRIESKMYPVSVIYDAVKEKGPEAMTDKIKSIVERVVRERRKGDILIFLSGEKAIKDTMTALYNSPVSKKLFIQPLYGRLGKEEQEKVFIRTPLGKTKVVISTNIAETSVTIDGITSVLDSGLAKLNFYSPRNFTSSLVEGPISAASSNQRKGRAGRTQPGSCYRLYSKDEFENRPGFTLEEIFRTDLSEVVLRMADLGVTEFENFDFLSPPGKQGILSAIETLIHLEALTKDRRLTPQGEMMNQFPLLPRHARIIVEAIHRYPTVLRESIIGTAFLSTSSPYILPQGEEMEARQAHHKFRDDSGDFVSYLKLFKAFTRTEEKENFCKRYYLDLRSMNELVNIVEQLEEIVRTLGVPVTEGGPQNDYIKCLSRGLIQFVCVKAGRGIYSSATAERIIIHPGSVLFRESPDYIVAGEIVKTSRMYARSVSVIQKSWLPQIHPDLPLMLSGAAAGKKERRKEQEGKNRKTGDKKTSREATPETLQIGGKHFKLRQRKGKKKEALFDWEVLGPALRSYSEFTHIPSFGRLKGTLRWQNKDIFLLEKVNTILAACWLLNPEKDILEQKISSKNLAMDNDKQRFEIFEDMPHLLKMIPVRKNKRNTMNFMALWGGDNGVFWYKPTRSFSSAVEESMAALSTLIDGWPDDLSDTEKKTLSRAYQKLEQLFD